MTAIFLLAAVISLAQPQEQPRLERAAVPDLPARNRLVLDSLTAARLNPEGLQERLALSYRLRLYDDPGPLWRDAHLSASLVTGFSPAHAAAGLGLTFAPLTILSLSATYYWVAWYGTIDYLQSYRSAAADFSDSALAAGSKAGLNYATRGSELELQAQALGKVGPVVLRNTLTVLRGDMRLHQGDRLYYDIRYDMLLPNGGWSLVNDTDLVFMTDWGLMAGARLTVSHAFYRAADFLPGEDRDTLDTPTLRAGPLAAYVLADEIWGIHKPTVLVIVNWWIKHRFRTGADVSQGIPFFVVGLKLDADLARWGDGGSPQ